ncbi:TPA: regulatory protein RecX [Morganella morganii]|nr:MULTISPECIES: regulatory protein RecX [Morganella]SGC62947.1 Regulatory protein recX [Mycobacterium tuberculosis]SSN06728.1 Regulatory protein RecX [Klebsiella pneumoniae]EJD6110324.1 regulatory protein RecX [Morganella morganii]EJG2207802.1 regulatory protein RecX [Morganella morganii]EKL3978151.1 regulatory protein RecX [Morganella morganii]
MDEKQLYHYAIWLLGRREYAGAELTRKLKRKIAEKQETSPTEEHVLPRVMARLTDSQYLDDTRSIALFFQAGVRKLHGPVRIRQELRQKGFDGELIDAVFSAQETDWFEQAREAKMKKFGESSPADYKEKQKQMRYLMYRGFTSDQIYELY